jgi:hypothetical protein
VFARLSGGKVAMFDRRNYCLVFANTGGAAKGMTLRTSGGEKYGPFDINSKETAEVELGGFKALREAGKLKIAATCEDRAKRRYFGEAQINLNSKKVCLLHLEPVSAE